jgi:hypothetical protein
MHSVIVDEAEKKAASNQVIYRLTNPSYHLKNSVIFNASSVQRILRRYISQGDGQWLIEQRGSGTKPKATVRPRAVESAPPSASADCLRSAIERLTDIGSGKRRNTSALPIYL